MVGEKRQIRKDQEERDRECIFSLVSDRTPDRGKTFSGWLVGCRCMWVRAVKIFGTSQGCLSLKHSPLLPVFYQLSLPKLLWGRICLGHWGITEMVQTQDKWQRRTVQCAVNTHTSIRHKYRAPRAQKKLQGLIPRETMTASIAIPQQRAPRIFSTKLATDMRKEVNMSGWAQVSLWLRSLSLVSFLSHWVSISVSSFTSSSHLLIFVAVTSCAEPLVSNPGRMTWGKGLSIYTRAGQT